MTEPEVTEIHEPPRVVIFDLETGGLDPIRTDIIEYAVLRVDPEWPERDELLASGRCWPELPVHPKAGEVNGFNLHDWRHCQTQRAALSTICGALDGAIVAGSNPQFDWGFVIEGCRRHGVDVPKLRSRHLLDVPSMAHPWVLTGRIQKLCQASLMEFFELGPQPHSAIGDVRALATIYRRLLRGYPGYSGDVRQEWMVRS